MTTIRQTSQHTAIIWKDTYTKLQTARECARAGKLATFEETNRQLFNEAQAHMDALIDTDGDALDAALLKAGAWLAGLVLCK